MKLFREETPSEAERAAQAPSSATGPESHLTTEERAKLEQLLRTMPGRDHGDLPA